MIPVDVVGIRLEAQNQPVLILKDVPGGRLLPLWIGAPEATAISIELDGISPARPLTHDLLAATITHLGDELTSVSISELVDGVFYALLHFRDGDPLSARPSDAVALAIRCGVPVLVAAEVMDAAALDIVDEGDSQDTDDDRTREFIDEFRAFLDEINPEDF